VLGVVLAVTGRFIAAGAAKARAGKARKRLYGAVDAVARKLIVEPVEVEVARHTAFNAALRKAAAQ
jgi:hypothetical protein